MDNRYSDEAQHPFLASKLKEAPIDNVNNEAPWARQRSSSILVISLSLALAISTLCNAASIYTLYCSRDMNHAPIVGVSSPILDHVNIKHSTMKFDGNHSSDSVYRHPGSVEVGTAWEALGSDYRPFRVPESDAAKYGLDPRMVKIAPEKGGGYPVVSWALFNIHCLNLIRRTSYWEYEYYKDLGFDPFKNSEEYLHNSTAFCIDILRQQLMCSADTGVMGIWWSKERGMAPDTNSRHQCKNFEAMRGYLEENQLHITPGLFKFREGDIRVEGI